MHTHDDFGMATANALAGIKAGATYVNTTVNGLGERAGNAALEEVVMALKYLGKVDVGLHTSRFRELSEYVAAASARTIPAWKSIVGTNVFAHESGIHADGVIKNPLNYEAFAPEDVGLERQIVVGKHSGSRTIYRKFQEFGLELTKQDCDGVLELVRKHRRRAQAGPVRQGAHVRLPGLPGAPRRRRAGERQGTRRGGTGRPEPAGRPAEAAS